MSGTHTQRGSFDRGQAYTLEGIVGALLVALALVLGIQVVDIAPWTDSDEEKLADLEQQAADMLAVADDQDLLGEVATCVDPEEDEPVLLVPGVGEDIGFEELLGGTLDSTAQYAVEFGYVNGTEYETELTTPQGPPSSQAVASATRRVPLFDDDELRAGSGCQRTGNVLADADDDEDVYFYLENQDEDSDLYGVVTIRVIVW